MRTAKSLKSNVYRYRGKLFRYDFDNAVVEYIYKASKEDIEDEESWIREHGRPLFDIDDKGYIVVDSVGLSQKNWKNKAARDEYLYQYCVDLDEEAEALRREFEMYEMPKMKGGA